MWPSPSSATSDYASSDTFTEPSPNTSSDSLLSPTTSASLLEQNVVEWEQRALNLSFVYPTVIQRSYKSEKRSFQPLPMLQFGHSGWLKVGDQFKATPWQNVGLLHVDVKTDVKDSQAVTTTLESHQKHVLLKGIYNSQVKDSPDFFRLQVTLRVGQIAMMSVLSEPILTISRAPKSVPNPDLKHFYCIANNSLISLNVKPNRGQRCPKNKSGSFFSRFVDVDPDAPNRWISSTTKWMPFQICRVDKTDERTYLTFDDIVCLIDTSEGCRSPALKMCRLGREGYNNVLQQDRVLFQLVSDSEPNRYLGLPSSDSGTDHNTLQFMEMTNNEQDDFEFQLHSVEKMEWDFVPPRLGTFEVISPPIVHHLRLNFMFELANLTEESETRPMVRVHGRDLAIPGMRLFAGNLECGIAGVWSENCFSFRLPSRSEVVSSHFNFEEFQVENEIGSGVLSLPLFLVRPDGSTFATGQSLLIKYN